MSRELTVKQRKFVEAYLSNGRVGAEAYRAAYSPSASKQRAADEAYRLLAHPEISRIVAKAVEAEKAVTERVIKRAAITRAQLIDNVSKLAGYDLRAAITWGTNGKPKWKASHEIPDDVAHAITAIEVRADGSIKMTFADKRAASVDLARLNGWITEKRDIRFIRSLSDLSDEELEALEADAKQQGRIR